MAFTIYGAGIATDGWITAVDTSSWGLARDASTGTADHNDQRQLSAIRARKVASGRGAGELVRFEIVDGNPVSFTLGGFKYIKI